MQKIKVGIIGGAGYTGGELLRILLHHPLAQIEFVHSKSAAGKFVYMVHTDLLGDTNLQFTSTISTTIDVLFLCVGHGEANIFLANNPIPNTIKIIDLSQDFRLVANNNPLNKNFVYGLPELQKEQIKQAQHIANPGCFATCIQLALLPLAANELLQNDIHISATTGSTGAGQSLTESSHFSWRNNNISHYKLFQHQHINEINQSLNQLQKSFNHAINFVPYRGNFTRGILATCYTNTSIPLNEALNLYEQFYAGHPFVFMSKENIDLKQVVNTNKCLLYIEKHNQNLVVTSIIDNLLKGASGQAVQNMNLIFGLDETTGLKLKASAF